MKRINNFFNYLYDKAEKVSISIDHESHTNKQYINENQKLLIASMILTFLNLLISLLLANITVLCGAYKTLQNGVMREVMPFSLFTEVSDNYENLSSTKIWLIIFLLVGLITLTSIITKKVKHRRVFVLINVFILALIPITNILLFSPYNAKKFISEEKYYQAEAIYMNTSKHEKVTDIYKKQISYMIQHEELNEAIDILDLLNEKTNNKNDLNEIKYDLGKSLIVKEEYYEAKKLLQTILEYNDVKDILEEAKYQNAIKLSKEKTYLYDSRDYFKELGDYKDSKRYLAEVEKEIAEEKMITQKNKNDAEQKAKYEASQREPAIGMSKEEVRIGSWGSPIKINTTTTKYGTSEQWVYSGNRYIYFESEKVTAIQK